MPTTTGDAAFPTPLAAEAPDGPGGFLALALKLAQLTDPIPTQGDLPTTGNWAGRTLFAEDTKAVWVCTGLPNTWAAFDTQWQTYTPTTTNVGGGTMAASYFRKGKEVSVQFRLGFTGANITAVGPTFTVPFPADTAGIEWVNGMVMLRDSSPAAEMMGIARLVSSSEIALFASNAGTANLGISTITPSLPFTWANGDSIVVNLQYRMA